MKTLIHTNEKEELIKGLNTAADIITSSMGGSGSTVIIKTDQGFRVTKDGVSIAESISLPDHIQDIGAQLLISAARETVKECGDGTTLTSLMLKEMVNKVKTKEDLYELKKDVRNLIQYINDTKKRVKTIEDIVNIARTSSNSQYVADLFRRIFSETSFDTHIELERTEEKRTEVTIDKGFRFNTGFDFNWLCTDSSRQIAEYENPVFYISKKPLHTVTKRIEDIIKSAISDDRPLIIVAEKYSKEFTTFIYRQVTQGKYPILILKTPNWGAAKEEELENLRAYLKNGVEADKIFCTSEYCIINSEEHSGLQTRLKQLKSLSQSVSDPIEAKMYETMYHTLSGNIATVWVGAETREARDELYDRIEDAVGATKSAVQGGYVAGMGRSFVDFSGKYRTGTRISIWEAPFMKIAENALLVDIDFVIPANNNIGVDLKTGEEINLLEAGIIDPAKTLITALKNALTNTELVLNTKYMLYNGL